MSRELCLFMKTSNLRYVLNSVETHRLAINLLLLFFVNEEVYQQLLWSPYTLPQKKNNNSSRPSLGSEVQVVSQNAGNSNDRKKRAVKGLKG